MMGLGLFSQMIFWNSSSFEATLLWQTCRPWQTCQPWGAMYVLPGRQMQERPTGKRSVSTVFGGQLFPIAPCFHDWKWFPLKWVPVCKKIGYQVIFRRRDPIKIPDPWRSPTSWKSSGHVYITIPKKRGHPAAELPGSSLKMPLNYDCWNPNWSQVMTANLPMRRVGLADVCHHAVFLHQEIRAASPKTQRLEPWNWWAPNIFCSSFIFSFQVNNVCFLVHPKSFGDSLLSWTIARRLFSRWELQILSRKAGPTLKHFCVSPQKGVQKKSGDVGDFSGDKHPKPFFGV